MGSTKENTWIVVFVLVAATCLFALCPDARLARYMIAIYAFIFALGVLMCRVSVPVGITVCFLSIVFLAHESTPILSPVALIVFAAAMLFIAKNDFKRESVYNAVCVIAIANVLWQTLQALGIPTIPLPLKTGHKSLLIGLQTHPNEVSVFLAVCLPAFFCKRWFYLLPIPIAGLFMAKSTVGIMAAGAAGCAYAFFGWRKKAVYAIATALAVSLLYVTVVDRFSWEEHRNSRLAIWQESAAIAAHKPFLGWGFGQYSTVIPLLTAPRLMSVELRRMLYAEVEDKAGFNRVADRLSAGKPESLLEKRIPGEIFLEAHNEYIEVFFAAGAIGAMLLILSVVSVLRKGFRQEDRIPFYGLLASSTAATVFFAWQTVSIAAVSAVWAGMCLKDTKGAEP